jgi:hypothetical protein
MPASGRPTSSSRRTNQPGSSRRDKTQSSQFYLQHRRYESSSQAGSPKLAPDACSTQPQRPSSKGRAYSAPLVPKSQLIAPDDDVDRDDGQSYLDTGEEEDEEEEEEEEEIIQHEIADDPFFQRFNFSETELQEEEAGSADSRDGSTDTEGPLSPTSTQVRARPDSTAEPLGSPLSPHSPMTVSRLAQHRLAIQYTDEEVTVAGEQPSHARNQHSRCRLAPSRQINLCTARLRPSNSPCFTFYLSQNVHRRQCIRGAAYRTVI